MKAGFERIDWAAPIDVDAYIANCPDEARVKGVIIQGVLKHVEKQSSALSPRGQIIGKPAVGPFQSFKDYPLREHMKLTVDVAKVAFPHAHLRESLRLLGQTTFTAVKETLLGKVFFGAFDDPAGVFRMTAKAREISGSHLQNRVVDYGKNYVHTHTKAGYGFLDSFHVGVAEGVCIALKRKHDLVIKRHSLSEAEFYLEWT